MINKDRRSRLKRPLLVVFIGIFLIILPFINYYLLSMQMEIHWLYPKVILRSIGILGSFVLLLSIPAGFGVLSLSRNGYFIFLSYAVFLILYNLYIFFENPVWFNGGSFFKSIIGVGFALFFLNEDISAPYHLPSTRGFRKGQRKELDLEVLLDGHKGRTLDISRSGIYIVLDDEYYPEENQESRVVIQYQGGQYSFTGGVVRVDAGEGIGIAFRGLNSEQQKKIKNILK